MLRLFSCPTRMRQHKGLASSKKAVRNEVTMSSAKTTSTTISTIVPKTPAVSSNPIRNGTLSVEYTISTATNKSHLTFRGAVGWTIHLGFCSNPGERPRRKFGVLFGKRNGKQRIPPETKQGRLPSRSDSDRLEWSVLYHRWAFRTERNRIVSHLAVPHSESGNDHLAPIGRSASPSLRPSYSSSSSSPPPSTPPATAAAVRLTPDESAWLRPGIEDISRHVSSARHCLRAKASLVASSSPCTRGVLGWVLRRREPSRVGFCLI